MILKKISYKNNNKNSNNWSYDDLHLNNIDLVVGYNSTGKTRVLKSINYLADLISGNKRPRSTSESFDATFFDVDTIYIYHLILKDGIVLEEYLKINDDIKLQRNNTEEGFVFSEKLQAKLEFSIPSNELALIIKRDKIQHPFLERLISWGNKTVFYPFGSNLGKGTIVTLDSIENTETFFNSEHLEKEPLKNVNIVVSHYTLGYKRHKEFFKNSILKNMKRLDYNLSDIGVEPLSDLKLPKNIQNRIPLGIYVKETDLSKKTFQHEMSQGMFRALSLIIQTTLCILEKQSELFIIDDIGEGLDNTRASNLIKILIESAKDSKIQLLMSTNDRYIMNNVPLEYWQVIKREHGNCNFYNYKNSKEIFDTFTYTGLSNFDFLATEFYLSDLKSFESCDK